MSPVELLSNRTELPLLELADREAAPAVGRAGFHGPAGTSGVADTDEASGRVNLIRPHNGQVGFWQAIPAPHSLPVLRLWG